MIRHTLDILSDIIVPVVNVSDECDAVLGDIEECSEVDLSEEDQYRTNQKRAKESINGLFIKIDHQVRYPLFVCDQNVEDGEITVVWLVWQWE